MLRHTAVSGLLAGAASSIAIEAQKPSAPDVLTAAGDYLARYSVKLSAIAAEEHYVQYDVSSGEVREPRRLTADIVLAGLQPDLGVWLPVRMSQHFLATGPGSNPINHMGADGGYNARQSFEGEATYSRFRRVGGG